MNKRKMVAIILVVTILASVIVPVAARYVTGGRRINGAQILSDAIDSRHFTDDSIDDDHINWGTGTNQVSATDINLSDCGAINSSGTITSSGTFDGYGAVAMTFGSADITSMTFTTDGTTNTEFTFPADVIGDADIDWGTGAGQVSGTDLTLTDCGVVTSTGTITSSGIFDATGAVAMTIGSVDITDMTFTTDGTGNAEFVFPADIIGDDDIDWGTGAGQVSGADITYAEGDMTDSMIIGADIKDDTIDSADYAAGSIDNEHLAVPKVNFSTSQTLLYGDFTDDLGLSGDILFTTDQIPAGAIPLGFKAIVTTGFTGDTTAVIEVGIAADADRFSSVIDQSVLAAATVGAGAATDAADGMSAAQTIQVTVTGTADFSSISAGSMTVYVYWLETA